MIGHNSAIDGTTAKQLGTIIDRIERLEEEKRGIAGNIKDVYAGAKSNGFDVKVIRKVIARRRRDQNEVEEEEYLLETYMNAIGQLAGTPLGNAGASKFDPP